MSNYVAPPITRTYSGLSLDRNGSIHSRHSSDDDDSILVTVTGTFKKPPFERSNSSHSLESSSRDPRKRPLSRAPSFSFIYAESESGGEVPNYLGADPENDVGEEEAEPEKTCYEKGKEMFWATYTKYEIVILVISSILVAKAYPKLGAVYVYPQITSSWIAVMLIFILAGMGLRTDEFAKATKRLGFNGFVQGFSFFFISSLVYGLSRMLKASELIAGPLADGMVICSCLPATINMVTVLTRLAGGDEAAAIFNCAFGNFLGIFISPVLILLYLGTSGNVDMAKLFFKLAVRVLTPIMLGQTLQRTSKAVMRFVKRYRPYFKKGQQYLLVFIVYTTMCKTFKTKQEEGAASDLKSIFIMIGLQGVLLATFMVLAWYSVDAFFPDQPSLRCMAIFGCTHKTVAMGAPLISAIYETDPNVGLYTLPLLIWHPMQLLAGSIIAPKLGVWSAKEKKRLAALNPPEEEVDDDDDEDYLKNIENESGSTQKSGSTQLSTESSALSQNRGRTNSGDERGRDDQSVDQSVDTRFMEGASIAAGAQPPMDDFSYAYSGGDSVTYASGDDLTLSSDRPRRGLPKCQSDHHFYEVGIVYQQITDPVELLNIRSYAKSARKCRDCGVRITTRRNKAGARPCKATPVYICMDCRRYLFCHRCWRQKKAPEWATSLFDLYDS